MQLNDLFLATCQKQYRVLAALIMQEIIVHRLGAECVPRLQGYMARRAEEAGSEEAEKYAVFLKNAGREFPLSKMDVTVCATLLLFDKNTDAYLTENREWRAVDQLRWMRNKDVHGVNTEDEGGMSELQYWGQACGALDSACTTFSFLSPPLKKRITAYVNGVGESAAVAPAASTKEEQLDAANEALATGQVRQGLQLLFDLAEKKRYGRAMLRISQLYRTGEAPGVTPDLPAALKWAEDAISAGESGAVYIADRIREAKALMEKPDRSLEEELALLAIHEAGQYLPGQWSYLEPCYRRATELGWSGNDAQIYGRLDLGDEDALRYLLKNGRKKEVFDYINHLKQAPDPASLARHHRYAQITMLEGYVKGYIVYTNSLINGCGCTASFETAKTCMMECLSKDYDEEHDNTAQRGVAAEWLAIQFVQDGDQVEAARYYKMAGNLGNGKAITIAKMMGENLSKIRGPKDTNHPIPVVFEVLQILLPAEEFEAFCLEYAKSCVERLNACNKKTAVTALFNEEYALLKQYATPQAAALYNAAYDEYRDLAERAHREAEELMRRLKREAEKREKARNLIIEGYRQDVVDSIESGHVESLYTLLEQMIPSRDLNEQEKFHYYCKTLIAQKDMNGYKLMERRLLFRIEFGDFEEEIYSTPEKQKEMKEFNAKYDNPTELLADLYEDLIRDKFPREKDDVAFRQKAALWLGDYFIDEMNRDKQETRKAANITQVFRNYKLAWNMGNAEGERRFHVFAEKMKDAYVKSQSPIGPKDMLELLNSYLPKEEWLQFQAKIRA